MYFGEKLKRLRQEKNWTQPDLAEKLGIEQSWLSKIENDKSLPSSELLDRIAEAFDLSLQALLEGLDPDYVANSLASLPEVRGMLQQRRFRVVHSARNWLIGATLSLALGMTTLISGQAEFFFSDSLFLYESEGLVFDSEPENLFFETDDIIESLVFAESGPDLSADKYSGLELQQRIQAKELEIAKRKDNRQLLYPDFQGRYLSIPETVDQDSIDIFGNEVAAGSDATRLYYQSTIQPKRHPANSVLTVIGIFLIVVSVGLFSAEVRLSRLISN